MLTPDMAALCESAKGFILSLASTRLSRFAQASSTSNERDTMQEHGSASSASSENFISLQMKRFPYLFQKVSQYQAAMIDHGATEQYDLQSQLNRYSVEVMDTCANDSLHYWKERKKIYSGLSSVAEDLLAAPASEEYVERIFSLTGYLTSGRRNRMNKSLRMRSFLKLNNALCK